MARVAFRLKIRADRIQGYDEAHPRVWPELLQLSKDVGVNQDSILWRGVDPFIYMQVDDLERVWSEIDKSPVNQRRQKEMESLIESLSDLEPGERFPMMRPVFHLE